MADALPPGAGLPELTRRRLNAAIRTARSGAVAPEDFGATGDGTPDTEAFASLADWLRANPGARVALTSGRTYSLAGRWDITGVSGVIIDGNGATIRQTADAHTIVAIPGESAVSDFTTEAVLAMTGDYSAGDTQVTLSTAANAGQFIAGAFLWIRSRQTITPNPAEATRQPVAELNVVKSADAATGVVTFEYPLAKDYIKDTTNLDPSTGQLFPHGLVVADGGADVVASDVTIRNLSIEDAASSGKWPVFMRQVFNCRFENVQMIAPMGLVVRGRFVWVERCQMDLSSSRSSTYSGDYAIAPDTGSSDFWIIDNYIRNDAGFAYIHLHEGLGNMEVCGNTLMSAKTKSHDAGPYGSINVVGSSWNVRIVGNTIVNGPSQTATHAMGGIRATGSWTPDQGHVQLSIRENMLVGHFGYYPIEVSDTVASLDAEVVANRFHCTTDMSVKLRVTSAGAKVFDNHLIASEAAITGAGSIIRQAGFRNVIADFSSSSADGARLVQRTAALNSPRVIWENEADGIAATAYMAANGSLVFGTNATAGATSGSSMLELSRTLTVDNNTAAILMARMGGANIQKRVSVGAADSGGAGFRQLLIAN